MLWSRFKCVKDACRDGPLPLWWTVPARRDASMMVSASAFFDGLRLSCQGSFLPAFGRVTRFRVNRYNIGVTAPPDKSLFDLMVIS